MSTARRAVAAATIRYYYYLPQVVAAAQVRGFALSLLILLCLFPVLGTNSELLKDSWALGIAKPLVGILFAIVIEGSRIVIVRAQCRRGAKA